MRVAVITSDFSGFTGSEIVALEAANCFANHGGDVTVRAERYSEMLLSHLHPTVKVATSRIDITNYDVVWSQHGFFCLNLPKKIDELRKWSGNFISVHLSGSTPAETFHHKFSSKYSLTRVFNCEQAMNMLESELTAMGRSLNMRNSAPKDFHRPPRSPIKILRNLLLVSNHVPDELAAALKILNEQGITVKHFGTAGEYRLITPNDIAAADAVITIGKTVQYALTGSRPVYCYDHFGGPGWLTDSNFLTAEFRNFSGRCHPARKSPKVIAKELISGFESAEIFVGKKWPEFTKKYDFESFLSELLHSNSGNLFDSPQCIHDVNMMRGPVVYFEPMWRDHYKNESVESAAKPLGEFYRLGLRERSESLEKRVRFLEKSLYVALSRPWTSLADYTVFRLLRLAAFLVKPVSERRSAKFSVSARKRGPERYLQIDLNE